MDEPQRTASGVSLGLTLGLQALVAVGLTVFLARREWEHAFYAAVTVALTLVPAVRSRPREVKVPAGLQLTTVVVVVVFVVVGAFRQALERFGWGDLVLHAGAGLLLGVAGFLAALRLTRADSMSEALHPLFVCLFGFTISAALGVGWEILEFTVDALVPGTNAQHTETGVVDTMQDLLVDTAGALVVSALGWVSLKRGRRASPGAAHAT